MEQNMKEIMEKLKVTASHAAEVAGKAMDAAGKKAGEIVESTKLNFQIFDLNADIEALYKDIGKSVYLTHTGVEIDAEEIDRKLALIDEKYRAIEGMKEDISDKKVYVKCPNCGKDCPKNSQYCSACGFELKS